MVPMYANSYMYIFETEHILEPFKRNIIKYFRFIDDILIIWRGTKTQAQEMVEHINQLPTPIRMTANVNTEKVQFLDVELSVENHRMVYSLYSKPTDRNTILHYNSAHPMNLIKFKPKAQFLRVMRNNSKEMTKQQQLQEMKMKFLDRGYSERVLDKVLEEAEKNATMLQDTITGPKLVFPMTFHSKITENNQYCEA
ncbi:Hypothetical predicted protein [Pelobates cultripes]|uniref:Helix-turn-helix domain-containing protein n=1 Tax=Pelobates cultripes TaxID=61616 RepID=A0AAD1RAJ3_PELCU|nr:Hypothetical predicted protein [Pelobates cultripes]